MEQSSSDEKALRRYLLGELAPEAQDRVEERLLTDGAFCDLLSITEDELLDDYLEGTLSNDEKEWFEGHFLATPEGRRKLAFAGTLKSYLSTAAPAPARKRSRRILPDFVHALAHAPRLALSAAAALVVIAMVGAWWSLSRIERLQAELDAARAERTRSASGAPAVVTFLLAPGSLRGTGEGGRVQLRSDAVLVALELELGAVEYPNYRAVLLDSAGDEIWAQAKLPASRSGTRDVVRLSLPSTILERGDYEVTLAGIPSSGAPKVVGSYPFRVSN